MDKKKCSSCGEAPKKCSCKNKEFTKAVVEINNPNEVITLIRKVVIPASMGDDTTVPPAVGKYKNVLLYYEANSKSFLYSSDGIPTQLVNGFTNYEEAINLPEINGVTLIGDKSSADLKLADAPLVITVAAGNTSWSGADTAEDVYNFFLNKGKVNIVFDGGENYAYEIASAAYIPGEEKMMCTLAVATIAAGETSEFEGNALFGTMALYTANKAIDVSQIDLQPKLYVTDFTGLDLNYNELSGVPATDTAIGMVKPGDGLEVDTDGTLSISDIEQYAHVFDTVADMKAATNLVNGSYAQTLGFRSVDDGGASIYKITDTGTANDMDIIQIGSGSLRAHLVEGAMVRAEQVGAYGDDTHDDTEFIQHLVSNYDYCLLAKTYRTTGQISLKTNNTIDGLNTGAIHGDAIDSESSENMFLVSEKANVTLKNVTIKSDNTYRAHDGSDHPNWNNTQSSNLLGCLIQWGSENITIENVKFNNLYTDIMVNSNDVHGLNKNIVIKDVVSHGGASSPIYLGHVNGCKINNVYIDRNELCIPRCHFVYCGRNGGQNVEIRNCHFEGNDYTSSLFNFAYANYTYGSSGDNGFNIILTDTYAKGCTPLSFKNISINFECNDCKFVNTPRLRDDGVTYEYGGFATTFPCDGAKFTFNNCKIEYVTTETSNTQALVEYKVDTNAPFEETFAFKNCDIYCHCLTRYNYNSKIMQFYNCNIECEITPVQRSKAGGNILIDDCNMKLTDDYISSSSGSATETVIIKDTLINTVSSRPQFVASNANWHLYLYNNIINSPNRLTNYFSGDYGASNTTTNNTFSNGSILTTS